MTRRAFIRAQLLTVAVSAAVYALVLNLAIFVEGVVFARLGWAHVPIDDGFTAWEHGFGSGVLDHGFLFLAAQVSGLLVGVGYYRFGGWWGSLLLPLTALPVYGALLAADADVAGWTGFSELTPLALAAVRLALAVLGALAFHRLARDVPIRRVTT